MKYQITKQLIQCRFSCVTGCLLNNVVAEPYIQPLNHSVAFSKERDIIISSDAWRVAINLDKNTYEEAISTIRTDLRLIEGQKTEFTPVLELKQIASLLDALELKLHDFQEILPGRDRRSGLINVGGTILKSLFGIATVNDLHELHNMLDSLHTSTSDIVHSLTNQVTYIK